MFNNWISVKKRLPTEDDVKRNSGKDLFLVTAIFGNRGHMQKTVYSSNFNVTLGSWDADNEIITHWSYLPPPAIVDLENIEEDT